MSITEPRPSIAQAHVNDLITRGALLHTRGCPTCKAIFALPLAEQSALIANARPVPPPARRV